MGPDLSDGIIIKIDKALGTAYIQDDYEDTIFCYKLCDYHGKSSLEVDTQVTYYKLYYEPSIAVGLFTLHEIKNPALYIRYDDINEQSTHKKRFGEYKFLFFGMCIFLGTIVGIYEGLKPS